MSDIGIRVSRATLHIFRGNSGLPSAVAALSSTSDTDVSPFRAEQVHLVNISSELAEKSAALRFPLVHIYCERVSNQLREKFRRFSGKVRMVAESRVSQGQLDELEHRSAFLSDAITEVLDASRGDWGNGMFYGGGYEIAYGPVKHGGKNYIQITKVLFEVDVSAD
jgi:hypothetical protein